MIKIRNILNSSLWTSLILILFISCSKNCFQCEAKLYCFNIIPERDVEYKNFTPTTKIGVQISGEGLSWNNINSTQYRLMIDSKEFFPAYEEQKGVKNNKYNQVIHFTITDKLKNQWDGSVWVKCNESWIKINVSI